MGWVGGLQDGAALVELAQPWYAQGGVSGRHAGHVIPKGGQTNGMRPNNQQHSCQPLASC